MIEERVRRDSEASRSYGSVHKAVHRESGHILAVKKVPVDTDLQEIIKEISIMQQCDSKYVVKYYGSYFKNSDLWVFQIVMEYCGAGSVSDIMRLRRKTLSESEIAAVTRDVLKGLRYLHDLKKIHRDIKAGNILLNTEGHAKLADFGVAGQLTAIFMIPTKPPPTLKNSDEWSVEFIDFIAQCLVKNPEDRKLAKQLLEHAFIVNAPSAGVLQEMIEDARSIAAAYANENTQYEDTGDATMVRGLMNGEEIGGTDDATLIQHDVPSAHADRFVTAAGDSISAQLRSVRLYDVPPPGGTTHILGFQQRAFGNEGTSAQVAPAKDNRAHYVNNKVVDQRGLAAENVALQKMNAGTGPVGASGTLSSTEDSSFPNPSLIDLHFNKACTDGDYSFLTELPLEELIRRKAGLEAEMDIELRELQVRYQTKRQPILDAIENKKAKAAAHF
uniref:Non-specific serine/threonine protein kinase n=1 Tax=Ascaris lumbricoides TaxID=6252 RepID=A0A0M3I6W0_ASCLU